MESGRFIIIVLRSVTWFWDGCKSCYIFVHESWELEELIFSYLGMRSYFLTTVVVDAIQSTVLLDCILEQLLNSPDKVKKDL